VQFLSDIIRRHEKWRPERKRPLVKPSRKLEDNIKVKFNEIASEAVDRIYLANNMVTGGLL
jgi:hypothetical protein